MTVHREGRTAGGLEATITVLGPRIEVGPEVARWSATVLGPTGGTREIWFDVPAVHVAMLAPTLDAALVGLLIPAMHAGADLRLEGPLSPRLLAAVKGPVQELLARAVPELRRIGVTASGVVPPTGPLTDRRAIGIGFSGGVDSLYSLLHPTAALDPDEGSSDGGGQPDLLIVNNVGSHGVHGRQVFEARRARLVGLAAMLGLPLVPVDSDLDDFFSLGFQATHTLRNAAVAHVLSGGLTEYLSSSTGVRTWDGRPSEDLAQLDPHLLPVLASERIRIRGVGAGVPRFEKTRFIAGHEVVQHHLDVCVKSRVRPGNCSACPKCLRTMMTLDVIGRLDDFAAVFDLRRYRLLRPLYAASLWVSPSALAQDLRDAAEEEGFRPVLRARRFRGVARVWLRGSERLAETFDALPAPARRWARRVWSRI